MDGHFYNSDSDSSDDMDSISRSQYRRSYSPSATERFQRNSPHTSMGGRVSDERDATNLASVFQKMGAQSFPKDTGAQRFPKDTGAQRFPKDKGAPIFPKDSRNRCYSRDKHSQIHTEGFKEDSQKDRHNQSPINLQKLNSWADSENYTILVFEVSVNLTDVTYLLESGPLPVDWTFCLFMILKKLSLASSQKISVDHIYRSFIMSNFLETHLQYFFQQLRHHRTLRREVFKITLNVFDVVEYVMENFNEYLNKCYSCLCMIKEEGRQMNLLGEGSMLTVRYSHLLRKAEKNVPQFTHMAVKQRKKEIPRADEEAPPDDFSKMKIFPDLEELEASYEPFLRANKTTGPYRDVRHYTDVHFRLLREDYLSPIRQGIKDYKEALEGDKKVNSKELRFYYDVQLVKMQSDDKNGITFLVKFNTDDLKDVKWEFSRRFMNGALVCFSKDNFASVIFATVATQNSEVQSKGQVEVIFESNLEDVFTSSEYDVYVMAETVSFFESYRHVLEGLQEVNKLPLASYIVHCRRHIHPPQYIDENTCFDFSPVMKGHQDRRVNLLSQSDWPDPTQTLLNDSQLEALNLALTNELAIIQGPPGTGKTYVGLKIMELILRNRQEVDSFKGPVLVVCYTNHALDQFLEGILEFCRNGIVRVGGRSQSKALEKFNINELRKNQKLNRFIKRSVAEKLSESRKKLREICRRIRNLWQDSLQLETTVLSVDDLEDEIDFLHLTSLTDKSRSDGGRTNIISQWMKAANANMERHINEAAKKHLVKMIVAEGDVMGDSGLLSKRGMVRPDFETRTKIYRGWLKSVHADLQERLKVVLQQNTNEAERVSNEILEQKQETIKDILPDDIIKKYMSSPDVFESVKKCVEVECGEHFQSSYVRSWLLDYFRSADQVLDAISHLSKIGDNVASKSRKNYEAKEFDKPHPWVIEASDDSDDDSDLGFNMRNNDIDSEEESDDETPAEMSEFRALEEDFKYSEKKEVLLLQRAKLLGINLSEETESSEEWQTNDRMTYSKVFRLLHAQAPYGEEDVSSIDDVWALSLPERYRLYKYWMLKKKSKIANRIINLTHLYKYYLKMKKEALDTKNKAILRGAQVIGMTTTGAAKHREILKIVAPQVIVLEEAAEVLEAHVITTLNERCKHLILIGDHQQLRPNPTVNRLAKDYDLEISLFERLVKNDLPMVILAEQHRMRPEVANYLRLIYPHLRDHKTVLNYDNVRGTSSNVFFLHHEYEEKNVLDSTSKENIHEADFLKGLCNYFMQQGYLGEQMTILAAYGGQVNILRENLHDNYSDTFKDVRITSIDNYQGEENDIILLSLVRSNVVEEIGFLKIMNRVCVALSRARRGLFVIGNFTLLAGQSRLWKKIVDVAKRTEAFGNAMKLPCVNHRGHFTLVRNADDFQNKVPEGGCDRPCQAPLDCGHLCPKICHVSDPDHLQLICQQPCLKSCSKGHLCQKECHADCGLCMTLVEKELTRCGHTDLVQCHEDEDTALCSQPCGQRLLCGHICSGRCGQCLESAQHEPCQEKVLREWPCSHTSKVECHIDVRQDPCPSKCKALLNCGHRCQGSCGECLSGRVHKICSARCKNILPCGHQCSGKCGAECEPCLVRCPSRCRHGPCSKDNCGDPCDACMENCAMACKHQQCNERCADECTKEPCRRRCTLRTKCQHACASLCLEECVCLKCDLQSFKLLDFSRKNPGQPAPLATKERANKFKPDTDTVLMKIPGCGHIFTASQLDRHVNEFDPNGSHYIPCPACPNKILGIMRYNSQNKSRMLRRENRKHEIISNLSVSAADQEELYERICELQLTHLQQKKFNLNMLNALICHEKFAAALAKIEKIHEHFNWAIDFNARKWKNVILRIETRVTAQFLEEMNMEFSRLLICEEIAALKRMIDDAGCTLEEPLKSRCKIMKHLKQKLDVQMKENAEGLIQDLYEEVSRVKGNIKELTYLRKMSESFKATVFEAQV